MSPDISISIRIRRHAIDPEPQRRIVTVIQPGDFDERTGPTVAVSADLDLRAFKVELGVAVLGSVNSNMLDPYEVLARRGVPGDLEFHRGKIPGAPVFVVLFFSRR